jgi:2-keto-4-pentenoate hydratase/2-oxohepta-3-ene-1,7-dioic acid hydratase in catechol pathway
LSTPRFAIGTIEEDGEPLSVIEVGEELLGLASAAEEVLGSERLAELAPNGDVSVLSVLRGWESWSAPLDEVAASAHSAGESGLEGHRYERPEHWLPPVIGPGKVIGIGANYKDHLDSAGIPHPTTPYLFLKPASTTLLGCGRTLEIPKQVEYADWEGELAVVIGRRARHVSEAAALSHVAGYTPANDFSARDWLADAIPPLGSDWILHKGWDSFTPLGPLIVPAEFVPDPQSIGIRLSVDGEVKQDGNTSSQVFSVAELIAHASSVMTLDPGDVLLTGTPMGSGFALDPQERLEPGQTMVLEVEGIGTLTTPTAPEARR